MRRTFIQKKGRVSQREAQSFFEWSNDTASHPQWMARSESVGIL